MRVAVVNTKGGVGKTTTAVLLACAGVRAGRSVEVWDADPQGSARMWALSAQDDGDPLPFEVRTVSVTELKRLAEGKDVPEVDMLVIDTPPGGPSAVQYAIDASELVIIPTQASAMDMQRVWPTLEIAQHRSRGVLITSADARTTAHGDAVAVLDEADEPRFETVIPKRQAVRALFGTNPGTEELWGYEELLAEIEEAMR